jgi:hypothetical protein
MKFAFLEFACLSILFSIPRLQTIKRIFSKKVIEFAQGHVRSYGGRR